MNLIDATDNQSCDTCTHQEGRHYCLLHSLHLKNMDTVRCADWKEQTGVQFVRQLRDEWDGRDDLQK